MHSRSPVTNLLGPRCPTQIARFVSPVVVDPVKRVPGRARTESGVKVRKEGCYIAPGGMHSDSSSAVVRPRGMVRVGAPIHHAVPAVVTGMVGQPVRSVIEHVGALSSGSEVVGHGSPALGASAGLRADGPHKSLSHNCHTAPAVAYAHRSAASCTAPADGGQFGNGQTSESIADAGDMLCFHNDIIAVGSYYGA